MARMKTISSIETELYKAETDLAKAQERVDKLAAKVLSLQKKKQEYEARQIVIPHSVCGGNQPKSSNSV